MTEFEFVTADDPHITCIAPDGELWENTHTYTNSNGERRFAYSNASMHPHHIVKSEDGILMVVGYGVSLRVAIHQVKKKMLVLK